MHGLGVAIDFDDKLRCVVLRGAWGGHIPSSIAAFYSSEPGRDASAGDLRALQPEVFARPGAAVDGLDVAIVAVTHLIGHDYPAVQFGCASRHFHSGIPRGAGKPVLTHPLEADLTCFHRMLPIWRTGQSLVAATRPALLGHRIPLSYGLKMRRRAGRKTRPHPIGRRQGCGQLLMLNSRSCPRDYAWTLHSHR